ncbi:hypothetical protein P7K49_025337 [Saguinus oedipus]|uniref:Uncharacterized protein n=1 Tax=Saguinus oedipus TaxID=9490 RepID=A0ABQ9UGW2_SAGOE|nr:hypothetical protein P7K49_025337 [Saguinus oedipus]
MFHCTPFQIPHIHKAIRTSQQAEDCSTKTVYIGFIQNHGLVGETNSSGAQAKELEDGVAAESVKEMSPEEDEEDEEMVEPKVGQDSELENQDKKQEVKEESLYSEAHLNCV